MPESSLQTYHLYHRYGQRDGVSGEQYRIYDSNQTLLGRGVGTRKSKALTLQFTDREPPRCFELKLRKTFALSGKIDLLDSSGQPLAIVTRSKKILTPSEQELLQFEDPTPWKDKLKEGIVGGIGDIIFGTGDAAGGSIVNRYVIASESSPVGTLVKKRLAFYPDPPPQPPSHLLARGLKAVLPRKWTRREPPLGWTLTLALEALPLTEDCLLSATAMIIELNRWAR
ncbi:hypothetical protein [Pelagicoccus sp. SDUM812003]|uniref:hypothetical protein n=1 Tax=Pelagicoccus sp. SDUM812003 TaxID=3041267 RepID=UPI00280CDF97|nr:hypothetical protein [Pelagicoccus sp. SDUM812003]MDQ8202627.1 hypothetical protein [Pelagicoccus sp. SDUM812003]